MSSFKASNGTWPRITVVTPSFNQGQFIEETIRSVLDQGYPNLEYIVIDGGSSDETCRVLEKYASQLAYWVSEPDRGQAHAINKGFARATGDIVAWLNSDDLYVPGALAKVARAFQENPAAEWLIGDVLNFTTGTSGSEEVFPFEYHRSLLHWVTREANPHQPGIFWKRQLLATVGLLREDWHYCFDAEFWCRLIAKGNWPVRIAGPLARFRLHPESKTCDQISEFYEENLRLAELYRSTLGSAEQSLLDRHMTYWRFAGSKLKAERHANAGRPALALRTLVQAIASDPRLLFRKSMYAKMGSAVARGGWNRMCKPT